MLPHVAYEQHAVVFFQPLNERVYLLRARHARFIDHVKPFLSVVLLLTARKMPLQGLSLDARFGELLCGPRCRRESFDLIARVLGPFTDSR